MSKDASELNADVAIPYTGIRARFVHQHPELEDHTGSVLLTYTRCPGVDVGGERTDLETAYAHIQQCDHCQNHLRGLVRFQEKFFKKQY
jgi:hypothetical protein